MHPYLNRKDRRQAARLKGRPARPAHHAIRPKVSPMLVGAEIVTRPLEQLFDELVRTGAVSVNARGFPQFLACDGHWYEAAPAIDGLIWHFEMWPPRTARNCRCSPGATCMSPCTT